MGTQNLLPLCHLNNKAALLQHLYTEQCEAGLAGPATPLALTQHTLLPHN